MSLKKLVLGAAVAAGLCSCAAQNRALCKYSVGAMSCTRDLSGKSVTYTSMVNGDGRGRYHYCEIKVVDRKGGSFLMADYGCDETVDVYSSGDKKQTRSQFGSDLDGLFMELKQGVLEGRK